MRYIALEEAFFIPELAERQPMPQEGGDREKIAHGNAERLLRI